jgi:hypothetical protein
MRVAYDHSLAQYGVTNHICASSSWTMYSVSGGYADTWPIYQVKRGTLQVQSTSATQTPLNSSSQTQSSSKLDSKPPAFLNTPRPSSKPVSLATDYSSLDTSDGAPAPSSATEVAATSVLSQMAAHVESDIKQLYGESFMNLKWYEQLPLVQLAFRTGQAHWVKVNGIYRAGINYNIE